MTVGQRIRQLREEHGLTQLQLGIEINRGQAAIWNYENGVYYPQFESICRLCEIFNISLEEFMKGVDIK